MFRSREDTKSFLDYRKNQLYEEFLNFLEEQNLNFEDSPQDWPLYLTIGDTWEQHKAISPQDKRNLTRPFRGNEIPRLVQLGACRDWAIEKMGNWMRIIPEGREMLLNCAREHNDTQFWEAVERFERLGKNVRAQGGSK